MRTPRGFRWRRAWPSGSPSSGRIAALKADPERSRRLSVDPTSCLFFLALGTHREAGAIADVRVRRAVDYAVDKVAYRDAVAGSFAPAGELA